MRGWSERIACFAGAIDTCIKCNDTDSLVSYCNELINLTSDDSKAPDVVKSVLTYYLANIYQHLGSSNADVWDNSNYGNAIICHRKFYRYDSRADELLPQVEVNHANALEELCRIFEAIPLWKKGICHSGDAEEVGLYRLASGLLRVSHYLYDESHIYYYQLYAYKYAKKLLAKSSIHHSEVKDNVSVDSSSPIGRFLRYVNGSFDAESSLLVDSYNPNYSVEEKKYRSWCKDNILFVNPLNDLESAWVVDHDVLNFPSYSVPILEGPYLSASFSSIKNEYCYCRHLFYEGLNKKYTEFTDDGKYLTDTLDGVIYKGYIEKKKIAIKGCFSVLDKVSRLLDKYYELNSSQIAFNRQWFDKQRSLKEQNNPFITALFWLSKDFSQHDDDQRRPSYWLDDSSFGVRELRNDLEHGWVRVVSSNTERVSTWDDGHDYAYTITSDELDDKGIYVLKQTRNALIYLCLAINYTEKHTRNNDDVIAVSHNVPVI